MLRSNMSSKKNSVYSTLSQEVPSAGVADCQSHHWESFVIADEGVKSITHV